MNAAPAAIARIALVGATDGFHALLRARCGLGPAHAGDGTPIGLGYCGREFRAYPAMRVAEAARFYGALNAGWDAPRLREDLQTAGLQERFEIRRMKRAYQRTIVLAFAMAAQPELLVVENAEEFDEPGAFALLEASVTRVARAIVTYGTFEALDTKASRAKASDGTPATAGAGAHVGTRYGRDALGAIETTLAANEATLSMLESGRPA